MVRKCHFDKSYYKIGNNIGVPKLKLQNAFYAKVREVYEAHGRHVYNVGPNSKLDVFQRCDYESVFDTTSPNNSAES